MGRSLNITSVTSKGQVTIPVEIRRKLGIKPHDRVRFVMDDGAVRIERMMTLQEVWDSVPPTNAGKDWDEIRRIVAEERAEYYKDKVRARQQRLTCAIPGYESVYPSHRE
jgi:AbrB family looped-hinge helix DNA binding protein